MMTMALIVNIDRDGKCGMGPYVLLHSFSFPPPLPLSASMIKCRRLFFLFFPAFFSESHRNTGRIRNFVGRLRKRSGESVPRSCIEAINGPLNLLERGLIRIPALQETMTALKAMKPEKAILWNARPGAEERPPHPKLCGENEHA